MVGDGEGEGFVGGHGFLWPTCRKGERCSSKARSVPHLGCGNRPSMKTGFLKRWSCVR